MKNKKNLAVIGVFLLMIFIMTVVTLWKPDTDFSERENRVLAQSPEFTAEDYFDGTFAKEYESYITDQFVARDRWIGLKTLVERFLLKQEINDIYFAEDGYLIEKHNKSFSEDTAENNIDYLASFVEAYQDVYGTGHIKVMVVPNAVEVLKDKLPAMAPESKERGYLKKLEQALPAGTWFDSGKVLEAHAEEEIFYRTDHHWKTLGAYYVYEAWAREIGLSPLSLKDYRIETVTEDFLGTIESKVGGNIPGDSIELFHPDKEPDYSIRYYNQKDTKDQLYDMSALDTKDKYAIFFGGNQPLVETSIKNDSGRRLLVIKDSYAHCFLPFAFQDFSEVDFIDLRYYNESLRDYMAKGKYTDVLILYNASGFAKDPNVIKLRN